VTVGTAIQKNICLFGIDIPVDLDATCIRGEYRAGECRSRSEHCDERWQNYCRDKAFTESI
jgi:hypothetical protein